MIILQTALLVFIGISSRPDDDLKRYREAIEWIRNSSEVKHLVETHLDIRDSSQTALQFAVFDTIVPDYGWYFFDEKTCSLITDRKKWNDLYVDEMRSFEGVRRQYYAPFSPLWDEKNKLILILGYINRNKLLASLYPRPMSEQEDLVKSDRHPVPTEGIVKVPISKGSLREITWFATNSIQIALCFDKEGKVGNAIVNRMSN